MPIQLSERHEGKVLEVGVSGKLIDADYERFVPEFERLAKQHGKVRLLFEMSQFHGWNAKAAWDDFKFGVKHHQDIDRLAVVGEKKWQQRMTELSKLFITAEVRYFARTELEAARTWLETN